MTSQNQLQTAAEIEAVTKHTVVAGLGYPAGREETSPQPTGWQASGADSHSAGALGTLDKVSRGTSE